MKALLSPAAFFSPSPMKITSLPTHPAIRIWLAVLATLLLGPAVQANTYDWSGATSGNMSGTPANWGGTAPTGTDVARWNAATYTNAPTANANMSIGELLFDAGNTSGVTFGAGALTLTLNGISGVGIQLNSGSGAVSAGAAKFSLGGDQTWLNNSANTLTVGGTITDASSSIPRTLTLAGTGNTTLSGVISNNGSGIITLTKTDSGTLTLGASNPNTFSGGLNVQQGTVKLAGSNSQGAGAGLVTIGSIGNSAVLDLNGGSRTINSLATAGTATDQKITNTGAGNSTVTINGAATSTFGGVIENGSGGGTTAIILNNAGANFTLSGANTYTGLTTVTLGTLKIGAANAINSGNALTIGGAGTFDLNGFDQTIGTLNNSGNVTNSGGTTKTLTFGSATSSTSSGNFTGAMNVIYNGSINNTMSGSWSNTGNITFNAITTNTITVSTGTVNNTGTITISGNAAPTNISANIGANVGLITQNSSGTLTLSGNNTNSAGVNLSTGTLKLGSATALGATAGTLTIAAGTTIDSSVASLVIANNNAQNWNGNFTFTGTNSLDLGTGAVALAAPITLTTTANTLTVGGTISGGTIFDITKAGAGTLLYSGNISALSSNQTVNVSAGTLAIISNLTGGYGITINGAGGLSFRGATTNAAASSITANAGSALTFDSSTVSATGTTRAASLTLKGGALNILGNAGANSSDSITGSLTVNAPSTFGTAGANTVSLTPDAAANTRLTAGSLVRSNNGAVFFRGTNLGASTILSNTANATNIVFTTAPTAQLVGGNGTAGSQNISIIPWAVGSTTASGVPSSFVTYDANGIRPLASGEYDTTIPATASTNNVKLSGTSTLTYNGTATINSLFLTNNASSSTVLAGTGALTVTSGAIYADLSLGGNSNALTVSKQIDFGTAEGVIGVLGQSANSKTLAFSGGISGSGGLTIYDALGVSNVQAGVNINAATTYTGNTIINGALIASSTNALPNFASGNRTGDVYVNGTLGLSGSNNSFVRINGLFGSGKIVTPFSNNETLIVGDNNATSTFDGTITQTSGSISLTKVGTGTLTLNGTSSTWTSATTIQNGVLTAVTLNNIAAPNATSSLGRPVTVALGTIGLGATTTTGTLKVVGTGETTDRVINLAGTSGGATLDQSGTGLLKFTSNNTGTNTFTATGAGNKTLTLQGSTAGTGEIAASIVDNSGTNKTSLTKAGTGTWTLSGNNSYTGATTVSAGTLLVSGSGSINTSSGVSITGGTLNYQNNSTGLDRNVTVSGGTFKNNSTQNYTGTLTFTSGAVGGSNLAGVALSIGANQTISPGNSPGTLTTGAETWTGGGTYVWEINNATGAQGTNWDFISSSGLLDITGLSSSSKFNINIVGLTALNASGAVPNWDGSTGGQSWKIASFTGITGTFAANLFNVDASGFTNNNTAAGTFGISNFGNDLYLTYAIPEPSTWALLGFSLTTVIVLRRRRSRASIPVGGHDSKSHAEIF